MLSRSFSGHWAWCIPVALAACQHAGVAPSTPPAARVATATLTPRAPVASGLSVAPELSASPNATPDAPDASPFVDGVRLGYATQLDVVGKSAVLSTEKLLLAIQDDRVAIDPALLIGLHPGVSRFPRVFGKLPDAAWAVEVSSAERTTRSSLARFTGSDWQNADTLLKGGDRAD